MTTQGHNTSPPCSCDFFAGAALCTHEWIFRHFFPPQHGMVNQNPYPGIAKRQAVHHRQCDLFAGAAAIPLTRQQTTPNPTRTPPPSHQSAQRTTPCGNSSDRTFQYITPHEKKKPSDSMHTTPQLLAYESWNLLGQLFFMWQSHSQHWNSPLKSLSDWGGMWDLIALSPIGLDCVFPEKFGIFDFTAHTRARHKM